MEMDIGYIGKTLTTTQTFLIRAGWGAKTGRHSRVFKYSQKYRFREVASMKIHSKILFFQKHRDGGS
jgi:hypothetical protein